MRSTNLPNFVEMGIKALLYMNPNVKSLILFGSRANGTHSYVSDIDLFLDWDGENYGEFALDLDDAVGVYSLDLLIAAHIDKNSTIYRRIQSEGLDLLNVWGMK